MWTYYLKIAWRNLSKNKLFSFLNISGLSIGMAVCILIMLFVGYEQDFDGFQPKNTYRLNEVQKWEGMVSHQKVALTMYPMGPTLLEEMPEVENFTRFTQGGEMVLRNGEKETSLKSILWTDSTFFDLFDFRMLEGDPNSALKEPNSMVLTASSAKLIFGNEPAMGKIVFSSAQDSSYYRITGVMEDIPANSHLQFEGLTSFSTYFSPQAMGDWEANWFTTYLKLADGADISHLGSKFPEYLVYHLGEERAKEFELFLQPIQEIHANSSDITHDYFNYRKFDGAYTQVFFYIGLIVLFIAGINFVNLSSAKSIGRSMEIGVRKASGALKSQLFIQFIGESIFVSLIALFFAVGLVLLALPYLNEFSQRQLDFPLFSNPILLLNLILGAVVVGVLSGTYPAFYLSNFRPAKVLKGSPEVGNKKSEFRNALVVVQFAAAVFLIITTLFATQQIRFMQEKNLGFSHDQVLTIPLNQRFFSRYESMKQEFLSNSAIEKVTGSGQRLGNNLNQTGIVFRGDGPERILSTSHVVVDPEYLDVYKIDLIAGRNFDQNISTDNGNAFIINESLAKELLKSEGNARPMESLIGQSIGLAWMDSVGQIVGISKDFNFNSLHHKIESLAIFNKKDWGYSEISVKIKGDETPAAIAHIESVWNTLVPEEEFQYKFLDDHFNEMYRADQTLNTIVGMLTLLSILISCLGLFGLVSFTTEQRVKEIGIRKVLGASVGGVVAMLSKDFMKLILVAILIAIPISWYVVDSWIQGFAYRIAIEWWVFLLAGMIAIVIALATVSSHAFKAAMMNPVDSLRSE